jgi:hypothetical protein
MKSLEQALITSIERDKVRSIWLSEIALGGWRCTVSPFAGAGYITATADYPIDAIRLALRRMESDDLI